MRKMFSKLVHRLTALVVGCLLPLTTLAADSTTSSPFWDLFTKISFNPNPDDISVGFLIRIFGQVPGIAQLYNGGTTLVGIVLGVFNIGILALTGILLTYQIVKILTETSMDGSTMGKNNTIWTAVRCSLSTSLLVPSKLTAGYSMINTIIMWIVIQGVGLADLTWNFALDYLAKSGTVVTTFTDSNKFEFGLIDKNQSADASKLQDVAGSSNMLKGLVCSCLLRDMLVEKQKQTANLQTVESAWDYYNMNDKGEISFFKLTPPPGTASFADYYKLGPDTIVSGETIDQTLKTGICGKVSVGKDDAAALEQMVQNLIPVAETIATGIKTGDQEFDPKKKVVIPAYGNNQAQTLADVTLNPQEITPDKDSLINYPQGSRELLEGAAHYLAYITQLIEKEDSSKQQKDAKDALYKEAKDNGWITAGNYYRLMAQIAATDKEKIAKHYPKQDQNDQGFYDNLANPLFSKLDNYTHNLSGAPVFGDYIKKAVNWIKLSAPLAKNRGQAFLETTQNYSSKTAVTQNNIFNTTINDLLNQARYTKTAIDAQLAAYWLTSGTPGISMITATALAGAHSFPEDVLGYSFNKVLKSWQTNVEDMTLSPILKLQRIGETMVDAATEGFSIIKQLFLAIAVPAYTYNTVATGASAIPAAGTLLGATIGIMQFTQLITRLASEGHDMLQSLAVIQLPMVLALLSPMFISGAILSVYVPIIPYLLFLFGAISWLIAVLVLMAAAPIICFLMLWGNSSQENPLLSREAEQFIMQIVGAFFRPTLMVIGLIAGIVLSYVSVDLLNLGVTNLFNMVVTGKSEGIAQFVKVLGVMIIYTFTMVSLVNICFSLIHLLYSEAMRIAGISAPAIGLEERQMEAVKGSISQYAEAVGSGMRDSAASLRNVAHIRDHQGGGKDSASQKGASAENVESAPANVPAANNAAIDNAPPQNDAHEAEE